MTDAATSLDTEIPAHAPMGHNAPPGALAKMVVDIENFGAVVTGHLTDQYADLVRTVGALLDEARELPSRIDDDVGLAPFTKLVKRLRDARDTIKSHRAAEKAPYMRAEQSVDSFFFALHERIERRDKNGKAGATDVLMARVDDYQQRKLAEEQQRRQREHEEAQRIQRAKDDAARLAEAEAEELRLAAERARKPEHIETKTAVAQQAAVVADAAQVDALMAGDRLFSTAVAAKATPAAMVRTRVEDGPMATMRREPYAMVEDADLLDKGKLWPFISEAEKAKALRAWAKTTGHLQQMPGASIGFSNKSVVR